MNIKRICGIAMLSLTTCAAFAQAPVVVTGLLKKDTAKPVKVFKVEEGKLEEIASTKTSAKGNFGFKFYPEYEGFYVIGTGDAGSPNGNYKFYFKGGEQLSVSILDSSYVLTGKLNSKENVLLTKWHEEVFPVSYQSLDYINTFVDFFPVLEEVAEKAKTFMNGKATGNPKFDKMMKENIAWDMANYATNFLYTPRSAHASLEEYSPYYETLKSVDFAKNTAGVYAQPWGRRTLMMLVNTNITQDNVKRVKGIEGVKSSLVYLPNDTLKGDFVLETSERYKTFAEFKELMDVYGKYNVTKSQKKKYMDILAPLAPLNVGDMAYNFAYPDQNGKIVTLADLKGKVVLIDVWATWCGPCKAQIPYLKKLEEEMKNTDLQVVSITLDEVADHDKWKQMIIDLDLGGIQLFASGWGDFAQYYKIKGIPRFMVYDKEGKIVTVDSPRPSNPELKAILEKALAK